MAKRFYKTVTSEKRGAYFCVLLDGLVLKTPGKQALNIAAEDHARLIAQEWDAQTEEINPAAMPLTRLMNVACERTPDNREGLVAEGVNYARTDLLSYWDESPEELMQKQETEWGPWLAWAWAQGIALKSTTSLMAIDQDSAAIDHLADIVAKFDNLQLTLFVHFTAVYGSAILSLAVMQGALAVEEAYDLSRLSARFQAERWGEDEEAAEIAKNLRDEIIILSQLIKTPEERK